MPDSKLHFVIPLPFAWTDTEQADSTAEITLEPAAGASFEFMPIGGVLGQNTDFAGGTVQWRAKHTGTVPVTVSLKKQEGQPTEATQPVEFAEPRSLEIDFAEVTGAGGEKRHMLLRGSIRIPLSPNGQGLGGDFKASLAALWPVAGDEQIVALRLEPAGLYLEGKLPAAMFPSGIAEDNGEVAVILRVPQQRWDVDEGRIAEDGKRFWTLESFDFGPEFTTAGRFLLEYAKDIEDFKVPHDKSFIDNVAASPTAETAVRIFRLGDDALEWATSTPRAVKPEAGDVPDKTPALRRQVRIQLGGGEAGEAAFYPDELTGKVTKAGGAWARAEFGDHGSEHHHVLVRSKPVGEGEEAAAAQETRSAVALSLSAGTLSVTLANHKLRPLSLPTMPLKPPLRDAGAESNEKPPVRTRSWLCTDQGWLAMDAASLIEEGARDGSGAGAIQGVIELEKIMAYLLAEDQSPAQDAQPDALQVQLATQDTTSVTLGIDYDQDKVSGVHLFLGDPLTTVITPSVWYAAPSSDQSGAPTAQPTTAELLPALSAGQDAPPLESMFQKASFISTGMATPSDGISAEITWDTHFNLRLQAAQLRLWHPIPDVPLAQSFSRTPDPSRDSTLDANRGLIPFEPEAKSVTLEFHKLPADNLPSVAEAPKSWKNLNGWTIPASQFPTRYFLPTLPGVEATLPVKDGEPQTDLRWGYRHAVPALDEAYAEVVEDPAQKVDAVQIQGGLDFTRVEGAEAFEIRKGDDLKATGWLLPSKDDPSGETVVKIEDFDEAFQPQGLDPQLKISLDRFAPQTITFGRTEDKEKSKIAAGLTGEFGNGQKIANDGQSLEVNGTDTHDGAGLETAEIAGAETRLTRLGQPETRITGTYNYSPHNPDPKDALTLELMGMQIGEFADDADLSDQRWMLHDGNGDWPLWRGWPLYPVKLTELKEANDGYMAVIEVVLLPQVPTALEANGANTEDDLPAFAGGRLNLTLTLAEKSITDFMVEPVESQDGFDWRFSPTSGDDVSLLRLRGAFGSASDQLTLAGLAVKHPFGVIDLGGDRIEKGVNLPPYDNAGPIEVSNRRLLNPESANPCDHVNPFDYSIKLERRVNADGDPYSITECVFAWTFKCQDEDNTAVKLEYSTGHNQWFPGSPWSLCVCRGMPDGKFNTVVGPVSLEEPQLVDEYRYLFTVAAREEYKGTGSLRLEIEKIVGVIGIKFSAERLTIESLTADIQVRMKDRHPDDLILLWDPVRDVVHSIDRNVGVLSGKGPLIGPAGKQLVRNGRTQEELFWADSRGRLRRWRSSDENMVREYAELAGRQQIIALAAADPTGDKLLGIVLGNDNYAVVEADILDEAGLPIQEGRDNATIRPVFAPGTINVGDTTKPITAIATSQPALDDKWVAWSWGSTVHFKSRLSEVPTISVQAENIVTALCISNDNGVPPAPVLVGVASGTLVCWKVESNSLTRINIQQVQARNATTILDRHLVVADPDGGLHFIDIDKLVGGEQEISQPLPIPAARLEGATLEAMVSLGRNELSNNRGLVSFAVLYSAMNDHADAAVFVYSADSDQLERADAWTVRRLETAECRPQRLSHISQNNGRKLLVVTGPTASSRLLVQVHVDNKGLRTAVTGRLTIQNNLDYVIKHRDHPTLAPHCTHRIDLYFDQAEVPAEAVFWSEHHSTQDVHAAALAHHVFRFPDGHERMWQAPQMVRFTSLERFAKIASSIHVPNERRQDLVLDASAVFWLQPAIWAEAMRYGVGAAAIANDDFRLWLLPRELRSFETGLARAVRLPAVACWAFDNAPFEVRADDAPPAPRIEIREGDAASDLAYWTSGVQRLLEPPDLLQDDGRPTYFVRGVEAAWLDAGFLQKRLHRPGGADQANAAEMPGIRPAFPSGIGSTTSLPEPLNDLLWLKDQLRLWLHEHVRLYCLEHQGAEAPDPIALLATIHEKLKEWKQGNPASPDDIDKFREFLENPPDLLLIGFTEWLNSKLQDLNYRAEYTDFIRGDSAFLASATLAHRHDPENVSQALDGPTLFEFPYRLRLEELSGKPDAGEKFDAQLLVFDKEGGLKRIAHEQLAPEDTAISATEVNQEDAVTSGTEVDHVEARKRAAEKWARAQMEQRRRYDAAFVLVDFASFIPVPRRFEAAYEDLPFTLDAPLGGAAEETADPRRRLPGLQRVGEVSQRTWLAAEPNLGMRVFAAEPAVPTDDSQKSVAATRFRLARAGGTSNLAPALVEPFVTASEPVGDQATPAQPRIVALSHRDDVPFEVQMPNAQGLTPPYPRDEGRKLLGQPAPIPANLTMLRPALQSGESPTDGQPASLLPPLVDVVSWAARPGEMMRSSFSANVYEYRGEAGDPSLQEVASHTRHPVAVSLRRPRARAGQQEAVRLALQQTNRLFHDRFLQAEFLLQQDLERTTPNELGKNGVQLIVVTQADVFKSAKSLDAAKASPAFYSLRESPTGDPTLPVVAVYLVATDSKFEEMLDSKPDDESTASAVVALHKLDGELSDTSESFFGSPSTSSLKLWKNELTWESLQINYVNLRWTQLSVIDVQALLAQLNPQATTGEFVLAQYAKIEEPPPSVSFAKPVPFAYVTTKLTAANFTPPKMSLSLLSWPQSAAGSETVALAGYGRLGPEDFSLIEPRADGEGLAWMRTARLRVIHRSVPGQNYDYDVVAYGPGGELIRTERAEPSQRVNS